MSVVLFGGSRSLTPSPIVAQVVGAHLAAGGQVVTGCAIGADAQVIQCCPSARVFAAFGPGGAGAWLGSAVAQVAAHPGRVTWWAGGPVSVPLRARLIKRSIAALAGCSAAVFFEPGPGSLAVAAQAVKRGLPVFAFQGSTPAPVHGAAGCWQPGRFAGFACWQWQPAGVQPALF
ncbi:MAG: hypothetical protein ACOYYS_19240 [Chloroflexota bacterium]